MNAGALASSSSSQGTQGPNQAPPPPTYDTPQLSRYGTGTNDALVALLGAGMGVGALGLATHFADPNGEGWFSDLKRRFAGDRGAEAQAKAAAAEAGMPPSEPDPAAPVKQPGAAAPMDPDRAAAQEQARRAMATGPAPAAVVNAAGRLADPWEGTWAVPPPQQQAPPAPPSPEPGIPLGETIEQSRRGQADFAAAMAHMQAHLGGSGVTPATAPGGTQPVNRPGLPEAESGPIGAAGVAAAEAQGLPQASLEEQKQAFRRRHKRGPKS